MAQNVLPGPELPKIKTKAPRTWTPDLICHQDWGVLNPRLTKIFPKT